MEQERLISETKELVKEIRKLRALLGEFEVAQTQTKPGTTVIRKVQSPKDGWDKVRIIFGIIGTILIPIIIPIIGWLVSDTITNSQLEASKRTAQSQLTKDYISMLAQAASREDDKELLFILDSLAALKETEIGIPPAVKGILIRINRESTNQSVLQASSQLISPEDRDRLRDYFGSKD